MVERGTILRHILVPRVLEVNEHALIVHTLGTDLVEVANHGRAARAAIQPDQNGSVVHDVGHLVLGLIEHVEELTRLLRASLNDKRA